MNAKEMIEAVVNGMEARHVVNERQKSEPLATIAPVTPKSGKRQGAFKVSGISKKEADLFGVDNQEDLEKRVKIEKRIKFEKLIINLLVENVSVSDILFVFDNITYQEYYINDNLSQEMSKNKFIELLRSIIHNILRISSIMEVYSFREILAN